MKKIILSISYIIIHLVANAQAPVFEWATNAGGSSDDYGHAVTTDASGNVYTTGVFNGTVDFDPGAGTTNLTSVGANDIFVSKFDAAGNFVWAKNIGGTANDFASSITIAASGNIYITGDFQGTADFDPAAAVTNLISAGSGDIFILKLDPSGNFIWAKNMGGVSDDIGNSIITDASENIYTAGLFYNTADFDPGAGVTNLVSAGSNEIFVSKLDVSGNFVWAKRMGGIASDVAYGIALDVSGNVYTTGTFTNTADFDPGSGTSVLTSSPGSSDIFVSKLDAAGNFIWAKQMGGTSYEFGISITTDLSGNVYTTGNFSGTADFDPGAGVFNLTSAGNTDIFISKLDASGNFIWARNIGGPSYDGGCSIALDALNNIYTTGYFFGTADFDPGAGVLSLTAPGSNEDVFISKLDSLGNFVFALQLGDTADDVGYSIYLDAANNIYTSGYFSGTTDFDPGAGIANRTSAGGEDIFTQKLNQTISTATPEYSSENAFTIFPNPATNFLNVIFSKPINNASIEMYNSIGALVYNKKITANESTAIELADQANGIYFIKVMSDNKMIASKKIIKQ